MRLENIGAPYRRTATEVIEKGGTFEVTEQEYANYKRQHMIGTRFREVKPETAKREVEIVHVVTAPTIDPVAVAQTVDVALKRERAKARPIPVRPEKPKAKKAKAKRKAVKAGRRKRT